MNSAKVSFKEKLGYGAGDFASNIVFTAASAFLTFFYTDIVGIGAAAVGTLLLVARVFDGFVDIGVGTLVDKTSSKHGKARPWLLWAAVPFGISGILLFTAPDLGPTGALIYAYVTYLLLNVLYSAINVPYGVLNSLVTQDTYQRSLLNIFRMVGALVGAMAVTFFTMPLVNAFGGGKTGWALAFTVFGVLAALLFLITFASTKERVKPSVVEKDVPLGRSVKALFRNYFWGIMVVYMLIFYTNLTVGQAINVYYAQYILNDAGLVGTLGLIGLVPMLIALLVLAPLIKRIGKRNAAVLGTIVTIVGSLLVLIDPTSVPIVLTGTAIKNIGVAPLIATVFAMLADTVDYGEWKTGIRTAGLVYSAGSFGSKAGSGLGAALVGWLLAFGGYVGGQATISASAHSSILFMFIYLPIILGIVQLVLLSLYTLDKKYPQIMKDLAEVKAM